MAHSGFNLAILLLHLSSQKPPQLSENIYFASWYWSSFDPVVLGPVGEAVSSYGSIWLRKAAFSSQETEKERGLLPVAASEEHLRDSTSS